MASSGRRALRPIWGLASSVAGCRFANKRRVVYAMHRYNFSWTECCIVIRIFLTAVW